MNASVGTSLETVYTVPSNKNSIIIGCLLCNKTGSGITADIQICRKVYHKIHLLIHHLERP